MGNTSPRCSTPPSPGHPSIYRGRKKTSRYTLFPRSNSSLGLSAVHSRTVRGAFPDCPRCIPGLSVIQKTCCWCVTDSPWGPGGLSEVKGRTVRHLRMDCPTPGRSKTHLCLKLDQIADYPSITRGLFVHHSQTVRDLLLSAQPRLGKTALTFSSDVRIRWSWTLWKAYSEDYPSHLNAWPKTLWIKAEFLTKILHKPKPSTKTSTPLQMCQPRKCTTLTVCELAFSQTFFKVLFTLFITPLDPSNIAMLDHSSGTRWLICKQVCPDSTTICPKPSHKLLYTPMTGEMKFLLDIPLPCAFHSISSNIHQHHHK
jgi:hypothetical protein